MLRPAARATCDRPIALAYRARSVAAERDRRALRAPGGVDDHRGALRDGLHRVDHGERRAAAVRAAEQPGPARVVARLFEPRPRAVDVRVLRLRLVDGRLHGPGQGHADEAEAQVAE